MTVPVLMLWSANQPCFLDLHRSEFGLHSNGKVAPLGPPVKPGMAFSLNINLHAASETGN
jgi:hypothetical protein